MKVKELLDLIGSPKKTRVLIFKDEEPKCKQLWSGYTYYPNSLLECYYDMKISYFNVANGDIYIYAVG